MTDDLYEPCERCGTEMDETIKQGAAWLCEACHKAINCGCEVCEFCVKEDK